MPLFSNTNPIYRLYSTPVSTGTTAAAQGAAATTPAISSTASDAAAASATAAAASAGSSIWSNLFFIAKYKALAPSFSTVALGPIFGLAALLEATQIYTGLPWWGVIAGAATLLRVCMTPLAIKQMRNSAIMEKLQPQMQKIRESKAAEIAQKQQAGESVSSTTLGL